MSKRGYCLVKIRPSTHLFKTFLFYTPIIRFLPKEADPKDNNPYDPPGGNYFLSTYHRLGNEPCNTPWETTTQAMLRQIWSYEAAIDISRPLVPPTSELLLRLDQWSLFCIILSFYFLLVWKNGVCII